MSELGARDIRFRQEDISKLSLDAEQFDHVFICFVLEHLPEPIEALRELRRVLKPGGTITVIEGDHGSALWRPLTPESTTVWNALIAAQTQMGYDPLIGRSLFPLLNKAGFALPSVEPRSVYADAANPELLDGVVSKIIVPMVETARLRAMESRVVDSTVWRRGIAGLERAGHPPDGTFFYSWFKGTATKQEINGEQYPKT